MNGLYYQYEMAWESWKVNVLCIADQDHQRSLSEPCYYSRPFKKV